MRVLFVCVRAYTHVPMSAHVRACVHVYMVVRACVYLRVRAGVRAGAVGHNERSTTYSSPHKNA